MWKFIIEKKIFFIDLDIRNTHPTQEVLLWQHFSTIFSTENIYTLLISLSISISLSLSLCLSHTLFLSLCLSLSFSFFPPPPSFLPPLSLPPSPFPFSLFFSFSFTLFSDLKWGWLLRKRTRKTEAFFSSLVIVFWTSRWINFYQIISFENLFEDYLITLSCRMSECTKGQTPHEHFGVSDKR